MHDRLYRSRDDRLLFGVAGGMADYLDLDPSIVRLVWALLVLLGGAGLLLYIVAAFVIPEEPDDLRSGDPPVATAEATSRAQARAARRAERRARRGASSGEIVVGAVLILVGGWFLVRDLLPDFDTAVIAPALLVVLGLLLVIAALRRAAPPTE